MIVRNLTKSFSSPKVRKPLPGKGEEHLSESEVKKYQKKKSPKSGDQLNFEDFLIQHIRQNDE